MSDQPQLNDSELAALHALLLSKTVPEPEAMQVSQAAAKALDEVLSEPAPVSDQPITEGEPIATYAVERDLSMGPATGASIKAFLEAKQAEADAKARAEA